MSNNSLEKKQTVESILNEIIQNEDPHQIVLTGAPGTGKTYGVRAFVKKELGLDKDEELVSCDRYEFVQFHPSYDYTDFVEGIRPVRSGSKEESMSFVRLDGIFMRFCRNIVENKETKPCYFVIDEINRADLSKVFGELMFLLEESYRGVEIPTQYCNLPSYTTCKDKTDETCNNKTKLVEDDRFKGGFYIPPNVYIIGTMNDIDRSVESFDFALRRRFRWVYVDADMAMDAVLPGLWAEKSETEDQDTVKEKYRKAQEEFSNIKERIKNVNKIITERTDLGLGRDFRIGPSYLEKYPEEGPQKTWEQIASTIKEYCRGRDILKTKEVLDECQKAFINNIDQ